MVQIPAPFLATFSPFWNALPAVLLNAQKSAKQALPKSQFLSCQHSYGSLKKCYTRRNNDSNAIVLGTATLKESVCCLCAFVIYNANKTSISISTACCFNSVLLG